MECRLCFDSQSENTRDYVKTFVGLFLSIHHENRVKQFLCFLCFDETKSVRNAKIESWKKIFIIECAIRKLMK